MEQNEYYVKRKTELSTIRSNSVDSFDKALFQISTGALVITITFIDKIGKPYDTFTNSLLIIFWALFFLVILANILSYWSAQKNMDFKIKDLDDRYKKRGENWQEIPEKFSKWKKVTEFCNQAALWMFVLGASLFFVYAFMVQTHNYTLVNKEEVDIMTDKSKFTEDGKADNKEIGREDRGTASIDYADVVPNKFNKGETEVPENVLKPNPPSNENK